MNDLNTQLMAAKAQIEGANLQIAQLQLTLDRVVRERNFYYAEVQRMADVLAEYPGALARLKTTPAAG